MKKSDKMKKLIDGWQNISKDSAKKPKMGDKTPKLGNKKTKVKNKDKIVKVIKKKNQ